MAMTGGTSKLLKTTYPFSDSSKAVKLYAYYKSSQDVEDNESTVKCGMYVTTPSGWDIGTWNDFHSSYIGKKTNTFDGTIPNFSGTKWIVENKSFTVKHDDDGKGTATIYWKWGVDAAGFGYVNPSGSFKITLPTIARASVPTLSAKSVKMGGTVKITTNRKSSSFTHDLTYTFGGTTKTIKTGVGASYTWTVPDLASKCNNATSGTCTITCKTKSGSTTIGTKTVKLTLTVPSATTPTLSANSVQMGNSVAISTGAASSNFTHTIQYSFGGASGTIATGLKNSVDWTPPKSLAAYTSNSTSGICTITCVTYNGTAKVGTTTKTLTLTVPSRTIPTLSATTVAMDTDLTITLPREVDVYVHDLTYAIIVGGGTTVEKSGTIATNQGDSYKWKVPLDLAKEIKRVTECMITITCTTRFDGSTTVVGSYSVSFTATVPNNSTTQPTLEMDLSAVSSLQSAFNGLYIQGKTKVRADFTATSTHSAIDFYNLTVDGITKLGDPCTSEFIQGSGTVSVKGKVTDARGYFKEISEDITVIPYGVPKVIPYTGRTKVICERSFRDGTKSDTGEYLHIMVGRSYSPVISGDSQKNFCALQYRYKEADVEFGEDGWKTLIAKTKTDSDYIDYVSDFTIDPKKEYTVQIKVSDDIGEYDSQTFPIASIDTPLHLGRGGKNVGIGQYCNYAGQERIDIGWTTHFNTGIAGRIIFANAEGWSEGTELSAVIPDSDITAVNEYNIFLAIANNSIPIICTMLGEYIYGGITTEEGSYAIKIEYGKTDDGGDLLTLQTAKNITQSQSIKLTALYALL